MIFMLKFTVGCDFGGQKSNVTLYIGMPEGDHHPLHFQSTWLSKERGGSIPQDVMDSLARLLKISKENDVSFEELCEYAIKSANLGEMRNQELEEQQERAAEIERDE
jgi:hypothetical protein